MYFDIEREAIAAFFREYPEAEKQEMDNNGCYPRIFWVDPDGTGYIAEFTEDSIEVKIRDEEEIYKCTTVTSYDWLISTDDESFDEEY